MSTPLARCFDHGCAVVHHINVTDMDIDVIVILVVKFHHLPNYYQCLSFTGCDKRFCLLCKEKNGVCLEGLKITT